MGWQHLTLNRSWWMRSRCERMASQREAIYLLVNWVQGFKARNFIWENSHPVTRARCIIPVE